MAIYERDRVLLCHRRDFDLWNLPGGRVEAGESPSFFCQVTGGSAHLTDEADKIKYFELERIPGNTVPKQIERIKDFFADKAKTYCKVQTEGA